jgi:hypothetical protein
VRCTAAAAPALIETAGSRAVITQHVINTDKSFLSLITVTSTGELLCAYTRYMQSTQKYDSIRKLEYVSVYVGTGGKLCSAKQNPANLLKESLQDLLTFIEVGLRRLSLPCRQY